MRALVLAAGGVTGALYEVGVLRTVEDQVGPLGDVFDLVLGVSAGATVSAFVSPRVTPGALYEALLNGNDTLFPLRQEHLTALDLRQGARVAAMALQQLSRAVGRFLPGGAPRGSHGTTLSGLFSTTAYERFLSTTFEANGLSNYFPRIPRRLLVPATDLDTTRRVVFGTAGWSDTPVSRAVAASSAIPGFFDPVAIGDRTFIDGNVGDVANLDVLLAEGVRRVLVVSLMVPVENAGSRWQVSAASESARGMSGDETTRRV